MAQRKPYNPNTKYGRKKLREQAWNNYENGTPEYRKEIDQIGGVVWLIIIIIVIIIAVIVYQTSGEKGLRHFLK